MAEQFVAAVSVWGRFNSLNTRKTAGFVNKNKRGEREMTHGSGECMGAEEWRMYCVHWNTLKAKLLRKSRADSRPATGRSWKPVFSERCRNAVRLAVTELKGKTTNRQPREVTEYIYLKNHVSVFLTSHCSCTNVSALKMWPCVYFSRCQTAFLKPIHCHSCWKRE